MKKIKWGLIGPGKVTHAFVKDLQLVEDAEVVAVASRSSEKAASFAEQYNITKHYGSYAALLQDAEVDIVYIATPPNSHCDLGINAMNAGKHILVETPLAVNAEQTERMIAAAQQNKVFMMEAFWCRFIPAIEESLELIQKNTIGTISYINAELSTARSNLDRDWRLNMELGGGALMTRASYAVALAYMILGKPEKVVAQAAHHNTGADKQVAAILTYKEGMAAIMGGFIANADMMARIYGTEGSIYLDPSWYETSSYQLLKNGKTQSVQKPKRGKGFTYEIQECVQCIQAGQMESEKWSHQNCLELKQILDEIRDLIGVKYPFELEATSL